MSERGKHCPPAYDSLAGSILGDLTPASKSHTYGSCMWSKACFPCHLSLEDRGAGPLREQPPLVCDGLHPAGEWTDVPAILLERDPRVGGRVGGGLHADEGLHLNRLLSDPFGSLHRPRSSFSSAFRSWDSCFLSPGRPFPNKGFGDPPEEEESRGPSP